MRCAVFGCNTDNQSKSFNGDVMFFRFPTNADLLNAWRNACSRADNFNVNNSRVCSLHFKKDDYIRNLKYELLGYTQKNCRQIKPTAFPTENLPKQSCVSVPSTSSGRFQRNTRRNLSKLANKLIEEDNQLENFIGEGFPDVASVGEDHVVNAKSRDIGTNTDTDSTEILIAELKEKIAQLESESTAMRTIFTPQQIKKLKNPIGRTRWSIDDISKAIVIHSAGARAYRLLLKKGYPFPAVSTLRAWLKKIKISPGILKPIFNIIKLKDLNDIQKVCVLSFDEIKVRKIYLYDKSNDETLKPYNYVQVVMLRGLFSNWKQPIFYDYDCKMTKSLLFEVINYVENSGFQVVAIVSDLGGGNRSLHNELQITIHKTWFQNPTTGQKIHVFADVPHLIKLIRNHFVDHGFIIADKEINKSVVEKVLELTGTLDLNIAHKISKESLNVKNAGRQKVKLATKLFSHTISSAISRCGMNGKLQGENWIECAEFFKQVNDWFDCLNTRVPETDSRERMKAYGLSLNVQTHILEKMTEVVKNMRVKGKKSLLPFQTGIIITNTSIKLLFDDLKERFDTKYILTYRLNQDVLENFFGVIRAKGGLHDHPDALEFRYRLRAYILGRNDGSLSAYSNVEEDDTPDLPITEINLSGQCFGILQVECEPEPHTAENDLPELDDITYDGLENLAGFICKKLEPRSSLASNSTDRLFSWVDHLSEGGLCKPSTELMAQMERLESIFNSVNGDSLLISKNYLTNLQLQSSDISCSEEKKKLFFRCRMFFRMRNLNKQLADSTLNKKRKLQKIIK